MDYSQYLKDTELFREDLKKSYLKVLNSPLDVKGYKVEAQWTYEVGNYLFTEYNRLKRKFWLIGAKRKENKKKVLELKSLLYTLNFHAKSLMIFRYNNEWRNNYDTNTNEG